MKNTTKEIILITVSNKVLNSANALHVDKSFPASVVRLEDSGYWKVSKGENKLGKWFKFRNDKREYRWILERKIS